MKEREITATDGTEHLHSQKVKAIKACAKWLKTCLDIGWDKSEIDGLQKIWWQHHDEIGNIKKPESDEYTTSLKSELSNLLAIIHRDGGHHEQEVGTVQAIKDAEEVVKKLREGYRFLRAKITEGMNYTEIAKRFNQ